MFIHNFKNNTFSKVFINTIISLVLFAPIYSFAADTPGVLKNPLNGVATVGDLIGKLLDIIIQFGTPLAALILVYTGFSFVTAMGNEKKLEQAKKMFWWTVIGTALIVGAHAIQILLQSTVQSIVTIPS